MTAAAAAKEEWVKAAMTDDEMVVELLLRLKQARLASSTVDNPVLVRPRWGIRKRRSRTFRCGGRSLRKDTDSAVNARGSPMTPLSWSGGSGSEGSASPSVTVDGFEVTSRQATCSTSAGSRSRILSTNEFNSASSKRSKTQKLDLISDCAKSVVLDELDKENSDEANERLQHSCNTLPSSDSRKTDKTDFSRGGSFLLPDLNMTPSEDDDDDDDDDDSGTETLYGTS